MRTFEYSFFSISNEFRSCQSQFQLKLYSNVLKTYNRVILILICCKWLLQLCIICALYWQNCYIKKKKLRKTYLCREQNPCVTYLKRHVVWPHCIRYDSNIYKLATSEMDLIVSTWYYLCVWLSGILREISWSGSPSHFPLS